MASRAQQIFFRLVPTLLLALLLISAELVLRAAAPSLSSPFVRAVDVDTLSMLQVNRGFLERYFPASAPMIPELKPTLLRERKGPGVFRVFCVGESSMFGTPYELSATIPALVRKQLRHLLPGVEIEVANFGASAINSNVIRDLAPRLAALRPDLVLIYLGHNEFYGPDGVGTPWLEKRLPALTRWKYGLRDLRIARLVQRGFASPLRRPADEERNLMKQVSGGATVEPGSPEEARILAMFRGNLHAILREFRSAGIPVIASDVSSNLMFPPFESRRTYGDIPPLVITGRASEAIEAIAAHRGSDTASAFLDYWEGRALLELGRTAEAGRSLARARDEDLLRFRAPASVDRVIHDVCTAESVPCCAADSLLASHSPSGITDGTLFWEHLHLNARGYDLLARMFVKETVRLGLVPGDRGAAPTALLPFNPDSLSLCWPDLAYGELSVKGLVGRWPFEGFAPVTPLLDSADAEERAIVLELYRKAIGWPDACTRYAAHAESRGLPREAMRTYGALIEEYPFEYYPRYRLAALYRDAGDLPRAIAQYRRSIALNGSYLYTRLDLGLILNNTGDFDEARTDLMKALELSREKDLPLPRAQICYGLAALSANRGDTRQALEWIERSLALSPSYSPARALRDQILRAR